MFKKVMKRSMLCMLLLSLFSTEIFASVVDMKETEVVDVNTENELEENEISNNETKADQIEDDEENPENEISSYEAKTEQKMDVDNTNNLESNEEDCLDVQVESEREETGIQYRAHVSNIGWQTYVSAGEISGTTGKNLPMEAIQIEITGKEDLGIKYQAHVSDIGWQTYVLNGEIAGTTGRALSMEAIRMELTGEDAKLYDIYYRAHVTDIGWMAWAKNGETAGTEGYAYTLQAIEIKLLPVGSEAPDNNGALESYQGNLRITHQAYVQKTGWMSTMDSTAIVGTTGKNLSLNGLKLSTNNAYGIGIAYAAHVSDIGWQDYVSDGSLAGIEGNGNSIEAVKIYLIGTNSEKYDIYYRAHVANIGWLDWAKNDEIAGSFGLGYAIEALDIRIVKKGEEAPGNTSCSYVQKISIDYAALVGDLEWKEIVSNCAVAGTTGKNLPLKALKIGIPNSENVGVKYRTHVSNIGWQEYVTDNDVAGVELSDEQIEAVQIELTGAAAKYYDVWYRVHSANLGWLDWTKNGEKAGTSSLGYSAQAIQVMVCIKDTFIPGSTKTPYVDHIEVKQEVKDESYIWPVPSSKRITSYFGYRTQPTAGASTYHQGIDIGASEGAKIIACKSGTVTACAYTSTRGYYVEITHGDGMKTIYMHMSKQAVSKGQKVSQGQTIGYVGQTGIATGPHLHLSVVKNGTNVNPLDYVKP